eukprot:5939481-Alexandrium_andersonii.AAC.1
MPRGDIQRCAGGRPMPTGEELALRQGQAQPTGESGAGHGHTHPARCMKSGAWSTTRSMQ